MMFFYIQKRFRCLIFLLVVLLVACNKGTNQSHFKQDEDLQAKKQLQGIWINEETESPLMRVIGDTIYYVDKQSAPITFKIVQDTLYTCGNDTVSYKIDKQGPHIFWFHTLSDNIVKLYKSEEPNDSLVFVGRKLGIVPIYTEVTKRDSIVSFNNIRYRTYVYINPSKMKVVKTSYSEDGISLENIYYDNVMHICVYEGKKCLYSNDITKQDFVGVVSKDFMEQSILSEMQFTKVDRNGFHFQAILGIPESQVGYLAYLVVGFNGKMVISGEK